MRFLIDAQLPPALAKCLQAEGHQAEHVNRIGLGSASDVDIWRHASANGSVLITKDADFLALTQIKPGLPPVIWVRLGNATNAALTKVFTQALPELTAALDAGERIVEIR